MLLTSELVTDAVAHEAGEAITLATRCIRGQLRNDVHDTSRALPVLADAPADAETGRGLVLVASLSAGWGFYRTPAGKAVHFTLPLQAGSSEADPESIGRRAHLPATPGVLPRVGGSTGKCEDAEPHNRGDSEGGDSARGSKRGSCRYTGNY